MTIWKNRNKILLILEVIMKEIKRNKIVLVLVMMMIFVFSANLLAMAHDSPYENESYEGFTYEKPIESSDISNDEGDPLGSLTKKEIKKLLKKIRLEEKLWSKDVKDTGDVSAEHWSIFYHNHYVDSIDNTYNGSIDRGEVASGYNGSPPVTDTLGFSQTLGFSNGWNTSIGFSDSVVSASVGYSVTYSSSDTFSYSMSVPVGDTGHIGYADWYHVQEYSCHTDYNIIPDVYGDGWSQQWYKKHFYSWVTPGNSP